MVLIVVQITLYIAWHDVPGPTKFGKYIGNANSDGPFVETGMEPALVVLKKTTEDGDPWIVYDAAHQFI